MGVTLYLMRHGAAEDAAPSGRDADRSLTPAGRVAVRKVALALRDARRLASDAAEPPPLGQIITSPFTRAFETAEVMATILGPQLELHIDEDLTPDGSAYELALRIARLGHDTLLVGHQPNIEMVARALAPPTPRSAAHPHHDPGQGTERHPPTRVAVRMPVGFRTATLIGFHVGARPPPYALALALDPTNLPPA